MMNSVSSIFIAHKKKENDRLDDQLNNITNKTISNKKIMTSNEKSINKIDFSKANNQSYKISINDTEVQKNNFLEFKIHDINKKNLEHLLSKNISQFANTSKYIHEKNFFLQLFPIFLKIQ